MMMCAPTWTTRLLRVYCRGLCNVQMHQSWILSGFSEHFSGFWKACSQRSWTLWEDTICSLAACFVNWTTYQTSWDLCPGFTQHPIRHLVCLANATASWFELLLWGWQWVPGTSCPSGLPYVHKLVLMFCGPFQSQLCPFISFLGLHLVSASL